MQHRRWLAMTRECRRPRILQRSWTKLAFLTVMMFLVPGCLAPIQGDPGMETLAAETQPHPRTTLVAVTASEAPEASSTAAQRSEPVQVLDECPTVVDNLADTQWPGGSILFLRPRESGSTIPATVLARALNTQVLMEVVTMPAEYYRQPALLSENGARLYIGNTREEPYEVQSIDLAGDYDVSVFPIGAEWVRFSRWGQTDEVVQLEDYATIDGSAVMIERFRLNIESGEVEEARLEFTLPNYRAPVLHPGEAFFSMSPDQSRVIYTATSIGADSVKLVLLEDAGGAPIWTIELSIADPLPVPNWSEDGSKVAVAHYASAVGFDYGVYVLGRDGAIRNLISSMPGEEPGKWVSSLSWSPDGRFLTVKYGPFPLQGGNGYVVDTQRRTMRPLCNEYERQFESVVWLDSRAHTLAYVRSESEGMESLNLLDAETWQFMTVDSTKVDSPVSAYRPIGIVDSIDGGP